MKKRHKKKMGRPRGKVSTRIRANWRIQPWAIGRVKQHAKAIGTTEGGVVENHAETLPAVKGEKPHA